MSTDTKGIGRAASAASLGTLGSRVIGFIRTWVLVAAIGTGISGDAYNLANNVPNMIFLLLGGGTIATIFVPRIVEEDRKSIESGNEYCSLLLVLTVLAGLILTVVVFVLFETSLQALFSQHDQSTTGSSLTSQLAVWLIPQIFFIAIISTFMQIANARGKFAAVSWSYAISSLSVIIGCILIIVLSPVARGGANLTENDVKILGISTLAGAAVQAAVVCWVSYSLGYRFRLPRTVKGLHLRHTLQVGTWTIASAACYQMAGLVTAFLAARVGFSTDAAQRGYAAVNNAQLILAFVQAIAVTGVASVLLQRMSKAFASKDPETAASQFADAWFRLSTILIPVSILGVVAAPCMVSFAFSFGAADLSSAKFIGFLVAILMAGFIPYGIHTVLLRAHYARKDAVTPLFSALRITGIWIALSFAAALWLPSELVSVGLCVALVGSYALDLPFKTRRLKKDGITLERHNSTSLYVLMAYGILGAIVAICVAWLDWILHSVGIFTSDFGSDDRLVLLARGILAALVFVLVYGAATRRTRGSLGEVVRWIRT